MAPFPPISAVGEIDELIRQFSSRPMTRQCETGRRLGQAEEVSQDRVGC